MIRVLQITHYADFPISTKSGSIMGETSQQRSGKKLLLVLTQITSFEVQSGFRREFETEGSAGHINPVLSSTRVTENTYPNDITIAYHNYEKCNEVSVPKT